ncbi:MAG: amino acid ABC transporter permease [Deltaproteobacteria bacterium]|jgi:polar amino acid transport system permease protein|nr:amino acid ABC transporter permease [Deltaproteobacteria bacterium]
MLTPDDLTTFIQGLLSSIDAGFLLDRVAPALNRGLLVTIKLVIPSIILGVLLGIALGAARAFGQRPLRRAGDVYAYIFRGVPLIVQLFIIYNALPKLGLALDGFAAAVLGFIMCSGAYHSEYIRGALLSVRQGQIRAAQALGFSRSGLLLHVVLPQALRRALPACGNEFIYLIKYTSLAYMTTCVDLTSEARNLAAYTFRFPEVFMVCGLYYLALTSLAGLGLRWLEKKAHIPGFGRSK